MMYFLFILLGFVLGSTLFAYWIPRLFFKTDKMCIRDSSMDVRSMQLSGHTSNGLT